jgi:drug/metabolite transporter (DMT)-like permease
MTNTQYWRGIVEMIAAQLIFGTAGWLVVASGVPVLDVIFWRCLLGAITLLGVCLLMGLFRRDAISLRQAGIAALAGVLLTTGWLLLFGSLSRASISIATAVYHTQPFILVGLGALLFKEKVTLGRMAWLVIAFVGMILIVQGKPGGDNGGSDYLTGVLMSFGAAFCYALVAILTMRLKGVRPHLIAFIQISVGAAILLPFADLANPPTSAWAWSLIAIFGVIGTGVVYVLLYSAYQKLQTHVIGALSFIYPVAAIVVDYIALSHRLQPLQIVGTAAILIAASGMTLGPHILKVLGKAPAEEPASSR